MKDIAPPPIIEHDPTAKMRPNPIGKARRGVCLLASLAFFALGFVWIVGPLDAGKSGGRMVIAGVFVVFAGLILLWSALFPNFTLAREHLDRRRRG